MGNERRGQETKIETGDEEQQREAIAESIFSRSPWRTKSWQKGHAKQSHEHEQTHRAVMGRGESDWQWGQFKESVQWRLKCRLKMEAHQGSRPADACPAQRAKQTMTRLTLQTGAGRTLRC